MRAAGPTFWEKMIITRCGVELEAMPEKAREKRDALRVVSVGRLHPEKGQVGLLKAFRAALDQDLNAELYLVGDGPFRQTVTRVIERLGLEEHVTLLGSMAEHDTLKEVAKADLFVMSSLMEGLPVCLMEALALEVPVIAPRLSGIPELVVHGETGLLSTPADWAELAERIVELGRDPERGRALARRGRQKVEEEFDINRAVEPLLERFKRG